MKRLQRTESIPAYVDREALAAMLCCGRATAEKIGSASGARVKFGRCVRYDVMRVLEYIEQLSTDQRKEA